MNSFRFDRWGIAASLVILCATLVLSSVGATNAQSNADAVAMESDADLALVPIRDVYDAVSESRNVVIIASLLEPNSTMVQRLKEASRSGATVSVGIEAPMTIDDTHASRKMRKDTAETASDLALNGVNVHWIAPAHVAVAIFDDALYVCNHDWPAEIPDNQFVMRDTIRYHRALVEQAFTDFVHAPSHDDRLWMRKGLALDAEAGIIAARTSAEVDVMTSMLDAKTLVYQAIQQRAKDDDRPRLLISSSVYRVSADERSAIAELQREGVEVRLGEPQENVAIDGYNVWYGSEPATIADIKWSDIHRPPLDIAFAVQSPDLAGRVHADFVRAWEAAISLRPPPPLARMRRVGARK
jgi:hypothetical protein